MEKENSGQQSSAGDLQDSKKDMEKMKPEISTIDLPDVDDIPGQENVTPAPLGELADVTISSSDEEGEALFGDDITSGTNTDNVTTGDINNLQRSERSTSQDDKNLQRAALDSVDDDGVPLNEDSFHRNHTPSDLDVPGAAADDRNEEIGSEDEENNEYSLGGDKHD
ncbi:hypothetical protein BH20BAC1_BH20BAC1_06360 [soil metagenome]